MKRQKARIIYPGGEERIKYPLNLKKFSLQELQSFVGGYIELVHLPRGNGRVTAYVNEEGKLTGMDYNEKATEIYFGKGRSAYQRAMGDVIVGPMVIVSVDKDDPDPDPTRWCNACGAQRQKDCKCGPLADND